MRLRPIRQFASDEKGVAAIETALVGTLLAGALLNVAEVSRYAYLAMEVNAAAQAGVQAALTRCDTSETPVTLNCPDVDDAIEVAIGGTSLGAAVTLSEAVDEAWYCLHPQGSLQEVASAANKPADCGAVGASGVKPGLYLRLSASFTYEPMFPGLTIVQSFDETIERSAMMRLL